MDTKQVIARFEAERQALALMDHPNIAKVFDAGTTSEGQGDKETRRQGEQALSTASATLSVGRPYFVMELVRGVPITDFGDQSDLSIRDRLELFVPVHRRFDLVGDRRRQAAGTNPEYRDAVGDQLAVFHV